MNILCPYCNSNNIEVVEYVTEFITEYDCIECYKPFYVEDIITSFIFMLEDNRIDYRIRKQYLESCKYLKDNFYVNIDR